jgi:hypothetical protein
MAMLPLVAVDRATHHRGMTEIVVLTLLLIVIGTLSGLGLAADTRDGKDWKPTQWPSAAAMGSRSHNDTITSS